MVLFLPTFTTAVRAHLGSIPGRMKEKKEEEREGKIKWGILPSSFGGSCSNCSTCSKDDDFDKKKKKGWQKVSLDLIEMSYIKQRKRWSK